MMRESLGAAGLGRSGGQHDWNWNSLSLELHVSDIDAPFLVNAPHAEYLSVLPDFIALREHNMPVEVRVYPDEYHVKWHPTHLYNIFRSNVQWFQFWILGTEGPEPVDSSQYKRWSSMRDHTSTMVDRVPDSHTTLDQFAALGASCVNSQ